MKWLGKMDTYGDYGPTQARIRMLNGIQLLQSQIYGKPDVLDGL